jgi:hypothetical protein
MDANLQNVVRKYTKKGWKIVSQTDTSCQLSRKNRLSVLIAVLLLLLMILPGLIYIFWPRGEDVIYLTVENGRVRKR